MAQRKGEATIEAAGTELVTSEVPSARSFRGNEDVQHSIPCRLFRNSSSAEAASRSKATSRNEELHARSARDSSLTVSAASVNLHCSYSALTLLTCVDHAQNSRYCA